MVYTSALVYWFLDRKPSSSAISYSDLRKWDVLNVDIAEEVICEGLWAEKSGQKWIPCVVLRLDTVKDAKALERRFLGSPDDINAIIKNAGLLTKRLLEENNTTLEELKGKAFGKIVKEGAGKGGSGQAKSTNKVPTTSKASRTVQLSPQIPPTTSTTTSSVFSDETNFDRTSQPVSVSQTDNSDVPAALERMMQEMRRYKRDTDEKLLKVTNEVVTVRDQNVTLKNKLAEQEKKYEKLEQKVAQKRQRTERDYQILAAMKKQKRECYAIKAGLLEVFSEDDMVYGVLSKQGLRNSTIARKQLDEELVNKVEEIMKEWSAYRGKPELSQEKFRDKVGTILETAKRHFKTGAYPDNEADEDAVQSELDGSGEHSF